MKLEDKGIVYLIILIAFMGVFIGGAIELVGSYPTVDNEPYTWSAPLMMLILLGLPALLGFEIGKEIE